MKKFTIIAAGIAFIMMIAALTFSASAQCSTCGQEGDWSLSATSFLEGKPIDETPQVSGPRAARESSSQFENVQDAGENSTDSAATPATSAASAAAQTAPAGGPEAEPAIILAKINANPANVTAGSPVNITVAFASSQEQLAGTNGSTASASEMGRLTVSATIRGPAGNIAGNTVLIKNSEDEYVGIWNASVPPGLYNVSLSATSLEASETFSNALQINVLQPAIQPTGVAPVTPAPVQILG